MPRKTRLFVFACLIFVVVLALPRQQAIRYLYPLRYEETLRREAVRHGVDPLLVAAIARVESHFNPSAVSSQGAIGVMQVMPSTGAWVAEKIRLSNWREERLYDPQTNIRVGTWYLSYLLDKFNGRVPPAIAAYNGGSTNVQKWLSTGTWDGTATKSRRIPFPETRRYVEKVMRAYEWYRRAYPGYSANVAARAAAENDKVVTSWSDLLANAASAGFLALLSK